MGSDGRLSWTRVMEEGLRLWRARRRHDRIDALLRKSASGWTLELRRNDRLMFRERYETDREARAEAAARLNELLRAGWVDHW